MKPKRMVTFRTDDHPSSESKLHRLCESMGKLKVEKSIHRFPLFSILKSPTRTEVDHITESLSTCRIALKTERKHYVYTSPLTNLRDLPITANAYYDRNYSRLQTTAPVPEEEIGEKGNSTKGPPYISVGQIIQIYDIKQ
jgi:hypothetical protein